MRASDHSLSETDIRTPEAEVWTVRADADDERSLLADAPVCPALGNYQIRHLGVARMPAPFEIVRTRLGGSYFLACFGGEGRVLVDGVVPTPHGAHFTSCVPDYDRDETFQRAYAKSAATPQDWARFRDTYLRGDESQYQEAVR